MSTSIHRRLLAAGALAAVLAVGVTACSSTSEQVSDKIADEAAKQLDLADKPEVTCPDDAKAEKGEKFTCTIDLSGKPAKVDIVFTDDTHFTFKTQGVVNKTAKLESQIKTYLAGQKITLKSVDCGKAALVVIAKSGTLDCAVVSDAGEKADVTVGVGASGNPEIKKITPTS